MVAKFSAEEILCATNGRVASGCVKEGGGSLIWNLEELQPGDWFVALSSEFSDAHDDLQTALTRGARGCIVNRRSRYTGVDENALLISVSDTRSAIFDLIRYWRYVVRPRVIGVSGSNGRRAAMVLLSQFIEGRSKFHLAFMDSLGRLGCARNVLSMPLGTEVLIFETGAIERGDISRMGGALDPDLAVIVQARHPLPSPERDTLTASLYCELLETINQSDSCEIRAVIGDHNEYVRNRASSILGELKAVWRSSSERTPHILSSANIAALSAAMQEVIGQSVSINELWCAIEVARTFGISDAELSEYFEVSGTGERHPDGDLVVSPLRPKF